MCILLKSTGDARTLKTWMYILKLMKSGGKFSPEIGHEIVSSKAYFSKETCAEEARLIAQAMFISTGGDEYGFKCVQVEYDPPEL